MQFQIEKKVLEDIQTKPDDLSGPFSQDDKCVWVNPAEPSQVNIVKAISIIIKTIIGAHIVLIPFAASQLGYLLFIIAIIVIIALHHFTSILLLKAKNIARHSNFETLLHSIFPSVASKIFGCLLMMINNLVFCILEFRLVKNTVLYIANELIFRRNSQDTTLCQTANDIFYPQPPNFTDDQYAAYGYLVIGVLAFVELPLIFTKKIEQLKLFSIIGVAGIMTFIIGVIVLFIYVLTYNQGNSRELFIQQEPRCLMSPQFKTLPPSYFSAAFSISIIVFALNFHMNFFPVYKGLQNPTDARMKKASLIGLCFCGLIYILIGVFGYYLVDRQNQINFLQLIRLTDESQAFFWILNLSFFISVLFNIALMFFTYKVSGINIYFIIRKWRKKKEQSQLLTDESAVQNQNSQNKEYFILTGILYLILIVISMFLQSMKGIIDILGAIFAILIVILLPCFFYVMLIKKKQQPKQKTYYFALAIIGLDIPFSISSFVSSFYVDMAS